MPVSLTTQASSKSAKRCGPFEARVQAESAKVGRLECINDLLLRFLKAEAWLEQFRVEDCRSTARRQWCAGEFSGSSLGGFGTCHGEIVSDQGRRACLTPKDQVHPRYYRAIREGRGTLDHVAQLTHVSRPRVALQGRHRILIEGHGQSATTDARGQAIGTTFSGPTDADGASAYWNPAAMTRGHGTRLGAGVGFLRASFEPDTIDGT